MFAVKLCEGVNVIHSPSSENVRFPVRFAPPCKTVKAPGMNAIGWTAWEKRTITRPFNGKPVLSLAGSTVETDGSDSNVIEIGAALLDSPLTVTITFPVVAPNGTGVTMLDGVQDVGVAVTPLNITVLVPCAEPKLVPTIVTDAPIVAEVAERLVMLGSCNTVNGTPVLAVPLTETITLPDVAPLGTGATIVVALQPVGVPGVPLNVTELLP
jgi:hypothetical protein